MRSLLHHLLNSKHTQGVGACVNKICIICNGGKNSFHLMGCSGLANSIISDHRKQAKRERDDGPRSARQQFRIQPTAMGRWQSLRPRELRRRGFQLDGGAPPPLSPAAGRAFGHGWLLNTAATTRSLHHTVPAGAYHLRSVLAPAPTRCSSPPALHWYEIAMVSAAC
jgi:hypothetical protein